MFPWRIFRICIFWCFVLICSIYVFDEFCLLVCQKIVNDLTMYTNGEKDIGLVGEYIGDAKDWYLFLADLIAEVCFLVFVMCRGIWCRLLRLLCLM